MKNRIVIGIAALLSFVQTTYPVLERIAVYERVTDMGPKICVLLIDGITGTGQEHDGLTKLESLQGTCFQKVLFEIGHLRPSYIMDVPEDGIDQDIYGKRSILIGSSWVQTNIPKERRVFANIQGLSLCGYDVMDCILGGVDFVTPNNPEARKAIRETKHAMNRPTHYADELRSLKDKFPSSTPDFLRTLNAIKSELIDLADRVEFETARALINRELVAKGDFLLWDLISYIRHHDENQIGRLAHALYRTDLLVGRANLQQAVRAYAQRDLTIVFATEPTGLPMHQFLLGQGYEHCGTRECDLALTSNNRISRESLIAYNDACNTGLSWMVGFVKTGFPFKDPKVIRAIAHSSALLVR